MHFVVRNIFLLLAGAAALVGGYLFSQKTYFSPRIEDTGPTPASFSLPDIDGKPRQLSEWQGRVVLLNFWATWCGPCRHEIPLFIETQKRLGDQLQIVGVSIDNPKAVKDYAADMRINYPLLLAEDSGLGLMRQYGNPQGFLPYTVVIDKSGAVVARKLGPYNHESLDALLQPLLSVNPAAPRT